MRVKSVVTPKIFSNKRIMGYVNKMKTELMAIYMRSEVNISQPLKVATLKEPITIKYVMKTIPGVVKKNCDRSLISRTEKTPKLQAVNVATTNSKLFPFINPNRLASMIAETRPTRESKMMVSTIGAMATGII